MSLPSHASKRPRSEYHYSSTANVKVSGSRQDWNGRIHKILERESCDDWAAKLQQLCEDFWNLATKSPTAADPYVNMFIKLLRTKDSYELASLVVPALRTHEVDDLNDIQLSILRSTKDIYDEQISTRHQKQADFDDLLYKEEKEIFADQEAYKVGVLLYNTGDLKEDQRQNMMDWLAARPKGPSMGFKGKEAER